MSGTWDNLGLDNSLNVHCVGRSGGRIRHLFTSDMSRPIQDIRPKIVLLQIGGNDLDCSDYLVIRETLARDLFSVVQWLINGFGVELVGVMQLLYRANTRNVPVTEYNAAVDFVNRAIKHLCSVEKNCFYWRHKGLKDGIFDKLCHDGVHLSREGLRTYRLSVRGAVLWGQKLTRRGRSSFA